MLTCCLKNTYITCNRLTSICHWSLMILLPNQTWNCYCRKKNCTSATKETNIFLYTHILGLVGCVGHGDERQWTGASSHHSVRQGVEHNIKPKRLITESRNRFSAYIFSALQHVVRAGWSIWNEWVIQTKTRNARMKW